MQFHNEVRPVYTATAAQLWLLFALYVSLNPLTFSLFLSYSLLYYFLSVFWACSFFLLSACFLGRRRRFTGRWLGIKAGGSAACSGLSAVRLRQDASVSAGLVLVPTAGPDETVSSVPGTACAAPKALNCYLPTRSCGEQEAPAPALQARVQSRPPPCPRRLPVRCACSGLCASWIAGGFLQGTCHQVGSQSLIPRSRAHRPRVFYGLHPNQPRKPQLSPLQQEVC